MKKTVLLLIALLITITSCNKIDTSKELFTIIGPVTVTSWDPDYAQTVVQKIYIEEFTGHRCTNCPAGARELKAIMNEDPAIIATAIHSTDFAEPGSKPPFNTDFKTPMGNQICADFNIAILPQAIINRMEVTANEWGTTPNKWRNIIAAIDRNNVRAGIQLQCTVDEEKQEIEVHAAVTIIKALPNPVQLCVILQQDRIISGQLDGNQEVPNYEHNHVLRTGFNGNYGTKLSPDGLVNAQLKYSTAFKLSYSNSFPNSYIPVEIGNCSVVAYLIDMVTKEVMQVEEFSF